jgi:hypothetical protein
MLNALIAVGLWSLGYCLWSRFGRPGKERRLMGNLAWLERAFWLGFALMLLMLASVASGAWAWGFYCASLWLWMTKAWKS